MRSNRTRVTIQFQALSALDSVAPTPTTVATTATPRNLALRAGRLRCLGQLLEQVGRQLIEFGQLSFVIIAYDSGIAEDF